MRRLVLCLGAANILLLLWFTVRPMPEPDEPGLPAGDLDGLQLIASLDDPALQARELCVRVGPFADSQQAASIMALASHDIWQMYSHAEPGIPLYRVYLPADGGPDARAIERLAAVRENLAAAGLDIDSYLVADGVLSGAISLGLFSNIGNAERVHEQVQQLGYQALVEPENTREQTHWLVARKQQLPAGEPYSWQESGRLQESVLISENLCEMIAHRK